MAPGKKTFDPGRPPSDLDRKVIDALMAAAARLLEQKPRAEISVRQIATEAGVNHAMIGYYFQTKDGLFMEFIERLIEHMVASFKVLEETFIACDYRHSDPTRLIIDSVYLAFSDHAASVRLLSTEIQNNTALRDAYTTRLAAKSTRVLMRIIDTLKVRGIYCQDLDTRLVAFTLETLLTQPQANRTVMKAAFDLEPDDATIELWLDFLTRIFDRGLR